MAYGFLRRVFEVFERFRTAVDMVTTSEVSVSVTVDDRPAPRRDRRRRCRNSPRSRSSGELALLCAVGDRLQDEPEIAARVVGVLEEVPLKMISQAASRRNITVVLRQTRSAARDAAAPRGVLRMSQLKILIVGYGKMGRMVEELAAGQDIEIVGRVDEGRDEWRPADVAIDFSTADALLANFPTVHRSDGCQRRHRHDRLERARGQAARRAAAGRPRRRRVGEFLDRRQHLSARRGGDRADDAGAAAVRRLDPRDPSQRQARCAVGHGAAAAGRDEGAPDSTVRSTCRRAGPVRFPARIRSDSTVHRIRSS